MKRTASLAAGVAAANAAGTAGARAASAPIGTPIKPEDLVIAFGHVGPISDEGWTWTHHKGLQAVQKAYPAARILEVESLPFSSQASRIITQFVQSGANLVFITSGYGDFLYDVAKKYPDVAFMECGRNPVLPNVLGYYIKHWESSYLLGMAAGLLSKSGKLGYIGSFPLASVFTDANSFHLGATSVNPEIQTQVLMINSWFDPQAATQAANSLFDAGCDVLYGIMDEPAYLKVAQSRGKWAIMWNTDMRRFGPDAYVSSMMLDWDDFYLGQVKARVEGTWSANKDGILLPVGAGTDRDAWGSKVPEDVAAKVDDVRKKIIGGFNPLVGPITDSSGSVRIPAGQAMDDITLYKGWDWTVKGVSGLAS
ncbi:MAG: BMP family ABC transporter substrate-binding protein [Parvibaculaceae bacterium]